jgi:3-keto-disaccharide hydrolase
MILCMNIPPRQHASRAGVASRGVLCCVWSAVLAGGAVAADKPPAEKRVDSKPPASTVATNKAIAWKSLFDGKTLVGWKPTDFAGRGEVNVKEGKIILESGQMTGITWTNNTDLPRMNYEISLEAMRVEGSDFFCGLTFPVGKDPCSLIVGGWGGGVVGLSSIDSQDAANNETTRYMNFQTGRWYLIRLRVTDKKIEAWIDADKVVDLTTTDRTISVRLEMEESKPLGIATWSTAAALRNLQLRRLP